MTFQTKNLVKPIELVPNDETPIAIVIGAMAHGQVKIYIIHSTTRLTI